MKLKHIGEDYVNKSSIESVWSRLKIKARNLQQQLFKKIFAYCMCFHHKAEQITPLILLIISF